LDGIKNWNSFFFFVGIGKKLFTKAMPPCSIRNLSTPQNDVSKQQGRGRKELWFLGSNSHSDGPGRRGKQVGGVLGQRRSELQFRCWQPQEEFIRFFVDWSCGAKRTLKDDRNVHGRICDWKSSKKQPGEKKMMPPDGCFAATAPVFFDAPFFGTLWGHRRRRADHVFALGILLIPIRPRTILAPPCPLAAGVGGGLILEGIWQPWDCCPLTPAEKKTGRPRQQIDFCIVYRV